MEHIAIFTGRPFLDSFFWASKRMNNRSSTFWILFFTGITAIPLPLILRNDPVQPLFNKSSDFPEAGFILRFKTEDKHGLGIGGADQCPPIIELDSDAINGDRLIFIKGILRFFDDLEFNVIRTVKTASAFIPLGDCRDTMAFSPILLSTV